MKQLLISILLLSSLAPVARAGDVLLVFETEQGSYLGQEIQKAVFDHEGLLLQIQTVDKKVIPSSFIENVRLNDRFNIGKNSSFLKALIEKSGDNSGGG